MAGPEIRVSWAGEISDVALRLAKDCDVAIVCVGNHPEGNASWGVVTC